MTKFSLFFAVTALVRVVYSDKLLSVLVIHRHGDRTPTTFYPNDPYKDSRFWSVGLGELTNQGKLRSNDLGQWLRQRYDSFLSQKYTPNDFYVRSTDIDRCLMSAASVSSGLFSPIEEYSMLPNQLNQLVPIHTVPVDEDYLLELGTSHFGAYGVYCKKADELALQILNDPNSDIEEFKAKNKELMQYVGDNFGRKVTVPDLALLYDTLLVELQNNLTLPAWTDPIFPEQLKKASILMFKLSTSTPELKRLVAGPLHTQIIEHFNIFANSSTDSISTALWTTKFVELSAHDSSIASVLNSLDIFNDLPPPYSSALIYELKQSEDDQKYINLYFRNASDSLFELTLPGCEFSCNFDKFRVLLENVTISEDDWKNECSQ